MLRRLAAAACAAALLSQLPALAHAAPDPASLPAGGPPTVTWQSGTTVHLPNGGTVTLPLGKAGAHYEVLGKRHGRWIVVKPGYDAEVYAVKGSTVRRIWRHVYDQAATSYTLAKNGDWIAEWNFDRGGQSSVVVFDLRGRKVASKRWGGSVRLLDFRGPTMLISSHAKTSIWDVPGKPVAIAPAAFYGDIARDILYVDDGSVGPTTISAPGAPAWETDVWVPMEVSPDGQYVAGLNFDVKDVLEVRRVVDGTMLPVPAYRTELHSALRWEPDGSLLVAVKAGSGQTLVRCTVAGVCERASALLKGQTLAFPG